MWRPIKLSMFPNATVKLIHWFLCWILLSNLLWMISAKTPCGSRSDMQKVIYYSILKFKYKIILWNKVTNAQMDDSTGSADGGGQVCVLVASWLPKRNYWHENLYFHNAVISTLFRPISAHLQQTLRYPQFLRTKHSIYLIIYLCLMFF